MEPNLYNIMMSMVLNARDQQQHTLANWTLNYKHSSQLCNKDEGMLKPIARTTGILEQTVSDTEINNRDSRIHTHLPDN